MVRLFIKVREIKLNKSTRINALLVLSSLMAGCGPQLYIDPDREACLSYGYRPGSEAFSDCLLEQAKMNRKDSRYNSRYAYESQTTVRHYEKNKIRATQTNIHQSSHQSIINNNVQYAEPKSTDYDDSSRKKYKRKHRESDDTRQTSSKQATPEPQKNPFKEELQAKVAEREARLKQDKAQQQADQQRQEQNREEERRLQRQAKAKADEARRASQEAAQRRQQERDQAQENQRRLEKEAQEAHKQKQREQERSEAQAQASIPVAPPPPPSISGGSRPESAKSFHNELAEKLKKRREQLGD